MQSRHAAGGNRQCQAQGEECRKVKCRTNGAKPCSQHWQRAIYHLHLSDRLLTPSNGPPGSIPNYLQAPRPPCPSWAALWTW